MVESDPLKKVDFTGAIFLRRTDELAITLYQDDRSRRYFKDKGMEADFIWLRQNFRAKKSPGLRDKGRAALACTGDQRRRARKNLSSGPQVSQTDTGTPSATKYLVQLWPP